MAECSGLPLSTDELGRLEREERTRRLHWSESSWNEVVKNSLPRFFAEIQTFAESETQSRLLKTYLSLVAEAIALQLLYPHPPGEYPNLYCAVLEELIPTRIRTSGDPRAAAEAMSALWNLCDAVSEEPSWVESVLAGRLLELKTLENLEESCRTFQRELTEPGVQRITESTDVTSLSYRTIELWPLGFFLPTHVAHCGPNVFQVRGRSPEFLRAFYVQVGARDHVIPLNGVGAEEYPKDTSAQLAEKLAKRATKFQLPLESASIGESALAAVFHGSQVLHVWQVRE